jgi:hypothetical protein
MNEALLALLTIASLRAAQQYLAGGRATALAALIVATTTLGLVKPPYLVIWVAMAGLFVERDGRRGWIRWELWLAGAVNLAAVALWFHHAHAIALRNGLSFGVASKMFTVETLLSIEYFRLVGSRLFRDVLGPIVLVAAAYGLVQSVAARRLAELGGVIGFLLHLVVVTEGNFAHNYYQLVIAPFGAVLAGVGITAWAARAGAVRHWTPDRQLTAAASAIGLAVLFTVARSASFHSWYELDRSRMRLCEDLRPKLQSGDLVAFAGDSSPDVLFCLDHRGWLLSETTPRTQLHDLETDRANVIVAPLQYLDLLTVFDDMPHRTILETPAFKAIRLER